MKNKIRLITPDDVNEVVELIHKTIRISNSKDYSGRNSLRKNKLGLYKANQSANIINKISYTV